MTVQFYFVAYLRFIGIVINFFRPFKHFDFKLRDSKTSQDSISAGKVQRGTWDSNECIIIKCFPLQGPFFSFHAS